MEEITKMIDKLGGWYSYRYNMEKDDMVQQCWVYALAAIEKHSKKGNGVNLNAYVYNNVRGYMKQYLKKEFDKRNKEILSYRDSVSEVISDVQQVCVRTVYKNYRYNFDYAKVELSNDCRELLEEMREGKIKEKTAKTKPSRKIIYKTMKEKRGWKKRQTDQYLAELKKYFENDLLPLI